MGKGGTRRVPSRRPRAGRGLELHYLDVPEHELWRRVEARNAEPPWDTAPITRAHLYEWAALFEAPDADEFCPG